MSSAPAHYYTELRRAKHAPVAIDERAVAIAHHRRYHAMSFCMYDPATCEQIDDTDREFVQELVQTLECLPARPDDLEEPVA